MTAFFAMRYAKDERQAVFAAKAHHDQRWAPAREKAKATIERREIDAMGPMKPNTYRRGKVTLAGTDWAAKPWPRAA